MSQPRSSRPSRPARPRRSRPARAGAAGDDKPRRLSTRARRQQILEVALEQFAERGFKGTTTRRIADAAGVTEACIFQHFAGKDALYSAVLAQTAHESPAAPWYQRLEALAAVGDDEAVVRAVFARIVDQHERDPHRLRLMVYAALEHHALSKQMQEAQGPRLLRFLERFVAAGQRAGRMRPGPPAVLARFVLAQPVFYILQRRLFRPGGPMTGRRELIETGVALALAALAAPEPDAPTPGVA